MPKLLGIGIFCIAFVILTTNVGAALAQTIPGQPANSWVYGSEWHCNKGYEKKGNQCLSIFRNMAGSQNKSPEPKKSTAPSRSIKPLIPAAKRQDSNPPKIVIASSITVRNDKPNISGRVSDESSIAQVSVNGRAVRLNSGGVFTFSRYVPIGGSSVSIVAVDEWGNKSRKTVNLVRVAANLVLSSTFSPLDPTLFTTRRNSNAVALIIGVANYKRTATAKFADKDALFFSDFARRKLGVSDRNIKVLTNQNAGLADVIEAVSSWLPVAVKAGASDVYLFFAGHGLSSADGEKLFLLPYDGVPKLIEETALDRAKLFDAIAAVSPRSVTAFLDTCYSGATRTEEIIVASRGLRIAPKDKRAPNGFTVFSASSKLQTAQMLKEAEHGLFSYFLMKGMEGYADQDKDNSITTGELSDYIVANVIRLRRNQTPELKGRRNRVLMKW